VLPIRLLNFDNAFIVLAGSNVPDAAGKNIHMELGRMGDAAYVALSGMSLRISNAECRSALLHERADLRAETIERGWGVEIRLLRSVLANVESQTVAGDILQNMVVHTNSGCVCTYLDYLQHQETKQRRRANSKTGHYALRLDPAGD
jgi:hypothetical protein